jgi:hypothetical protein
VRDEESIPKGRFAVKLPINEHWKSILWNQYGAAIDTLENAIRACPEDLWGDRSRRHEYWYWAYHTLFWLDLDLSGRVVEGFNPPPPYTLEELDPAGIIPARVYTKDELLSYVEHCRAKAFAAIHGLTEESAQRICRFGGGEGTYVELLLYSMRHVQHHSAQFNLILRETIDSAPPWVSRAKRHAVSP